MRIGIDIDGVLTDLEKWQLDVASKYMVENFNQSIVDYQGYTTDIIYGISKKQNQIFWDKYRDDYTQNTVARNFASEVINRLSREGHEIYIITARIFTDEQSDRGEKMRTTVKKWLKDNNINYNQLIFSPEDKLEICLENLIDIMIDDRVANIETISTEIPVVCYHANYNKDLIGNNIYRAYSWYDIYYQINNVIKR